MFFNRDTLLASLVPRMPQKVEDVATDCLVYILTKSKPARSALNSLIGNTVPDTVEECIRFNAQITEDGSRFDFVGYGQGDEKRVIGEAKLDADLGSGQGGGYLSQLPDSSSVLLFVVPDHRIDHLWGKVVDDVLNWEGGPGELETVPDVPERVRCSRDKGSHRYVMMVSWRQLLQRMYEFTTEEPGVQSDIHQLQGVVEFMDAFEPIGEEELSSSFPRRMLSLVRLVDDALDLGQQQQWITPLETNWSSPRDHRSAGWFLRISNARVTGWFGIYHELWARRDCVDSPLWLQLDGMSPSVMNKLAAGLGLQVVDESYLPVHLKTNASYDEVLGDVVSQLNAIRAAIEEIGPED